MSFFANEPVQVVLVNDLLTFAYDVEFVVEQAASVAEGMAMLTAEKFDVVLFDADLLDTTGWDAVTTPTHYANATIGHYCQFT